MLIMFDLKLKKLIMNQKNSMEVIQATVNNRYRSSSKTQTFRIII